MLAKVFSCAVIGLEGAIVQVEVDISRGLPRFTVVGLPDPAVQESSGTRRIGVPERTILWVGLLCISGTAPLSEQDSDSQPTGGNAMHATSSGHGLPEARGGCGADSGGFRDDASGIG